MENKKHVLMCVIGRTASGKDTLVGQLCERSECRQLISYTTRAPRQDESNTHKFVDEEVYWSMRSNNEIAVDTCISGNYYWSTIEQLYESDTYVIDYIGYKKLQALNLPNMKLVSVFINTPDEIREQRALQKRKDDKIIFKKRNLDEAPQFRDMLKKADFDYAIQNRDFATAFSVLKWISTVEGVWQNHQEDTTE